MANDTYRVRGVAYIFLFPALGGLLFGYDIGATSYVLPQLTSEKYSGVSWWPQVKHSAVLQGLITSGSLFGALIGATIVFRIADMLGRRREIMIGAMLYALGSILEYGSGAVGGIATLVAGRIVYGVGCGFVMHGAPAYIAEMSPAQIRGMLVSLKEAAIVLGICVGYGAGYAFSHVSQGWRYTYAISAPLAFILFFGMRSLPPSARWLALQGRDPERSLRFVWGDSYVEALSELSGVDTSEAESGHLFDAKYFPALRAGIGVVILQQITGQPSVLYYATTIFDSAGIGAIATVFVGIFKLLATLLSVSVVDTKGRRVVLSSGIVVMLVALVGLTTSFAFFSSGQDGFTPLKGFVVGLIFLYVLGYQLGFGPIAWCLISELFPLEVRGQAIALAVQANFASNLLVTFLFPVAQKSIANALGDRFSLSFLFGIFAVLDLYSLYFVLRYVPETKGLTLEQIQANIIRLGRGTPSFDETPLLRNGQSQNTPLVVPSPTP